MATLSPLAQRQAMIVSGIPYAEAQASINKGSANYQPYAGFGFPTSQAGSDIKNWYTPPVAVTTPPVAPKVQDIPSPTAIMELQGQQGRPTPGYDKDNPPPFGTPEYTEWYYAGFGFPTVAGTTPPVAPKVQDIPSPPTIPTTTTENTTLEPPNLGWYLGMNPNTDVYPNWYWGQGEVEKNAADKAAADALLKTTTTGGGAVTTPTGTEVISPAVDWKVTTEGGWVLMVGYDAKGNVVSKEPMGQVNNPPATVPPLPSDAGTIFTNEYGTWEKGYDLEGGQWEPANKLVKASGEPEKNYPLPTGVSSTNYDANGNEYLYNPRTGSWQPTGKYNPAYDQAYRQTQEQQGAQYAAQAAQQQQLIGWYKQQQTTQLEADKQQRLATLRANPVSWLEYASLSGQTPTIQPWMLPLQGKDYGFQMGAAMPGWTTGGTNTLPELLTPSAQYLARLSPSQRQQYYGYIGMQTGMSPSDIESKLWAMAPSGGGYGGVRYVSYKR